MKIGFIGTGNMGQAILRGYLKVYAELAKEVFVYNHHREKAEKLAQELGVTACASIEELVGAADIILLAVKPAQFVEVMPEVKDAVEKKQAAGEKTIVSIAAGVTISYLEGFFKGMNRGMKIVRVMPNTPALVGEAMSSVSINDAVDEGTKKAVLEIFSAVGRVQVVNETLIDAVIGVSGSAPAYVYLFIEALADGAVAEGMPRAQAYEFAAQTVFGSAKMVLETGVHPAVLKDQVCSPGGTTIEAVNILEKTGFRTSVIEAVHAAAVKSARMAGKN